MMELKGSRLATNEWRPNRVTIYDDRVEEVNAGLASSTTNTIRVEQIAQVSVTSGLRKATLTVESTGGKQIVAKGLPKDQAEQARRLLNDLACRA